MINDNDKLVISRKQLHAMLKSYWNAGFTMAASISENKVLLRIVRQEKKRSADGRFITTKTKKQTTR